MVRLSVDAYNELPKIALNGLICWLDAESNSSLTRLYRNEFTQKENPAIYNTYLYDGRDSKAVFFINGHNRIAVPFVNLSSTTMLAAGVEWFGRGPMQRIPVGFRIGSMGGYANLCSPADNLVITSLLFYDVRGWFDSEYVNIPIKCSDSNCPQHIPKGVSGSIRSLLNTVSGSPGVSGVITSSTFNMSGQMSPISGYFGTNDLLAFYARCSRSWLDSLTPFSDSFGVNVVDDDNVVLPKERWFGQFLNGFTWSESGADYHNMLLS